MVKFVNDLGKINGKYQPEISHEVEEEGNQTNKEVKKNVLKRQFTSTSTIIPQHIIYSPSLIRNTCIGWCQRPYESAVTLSKKVILFIVI